MCFCALHWGVTPLILLAVLPGSSEVRVPDLHRGQSCHPWTGERDWELIPLATVVVGERLGINSTSSSSCGIPSAISPLDGLMSCLCCQTFLWWEKGGTKYEECHQNIEQLSPHRMFRVCCSCFVTQGYPNYVIRYQQGTRRFGLCSEELGKLAFFQKNWKFGSTQKIWSQTGALILNFL